MKYLRVREIERPDFVAKHYHNWACISYRSWFGDAQVNIERKFIRNGVIKVSESDQSPWNDCVLVTLLGLSKGSFRFLTWVRQADLFERIEDAIDHNDASHADGNDSDQSDDHGPTVVGPGRNVEMSNG